MHARRFYKVSPSSVERYLELHTLSHIPHPLRFNLDSVACWCTRITTPLPLGFGLVTVAHYDQATYIFPFSSPILFFTYMYIPLQPPSKTVICCDSENPFSLYSCRGIS